MGKKVCNKFYIDSDGERSEAMPESPAVVGFEVFDPDHVGTEEQPVKILETYQMALSDLPAAIQTQLMAMGLAQKAGDKYAGKNGQDAAEQLEIIFDQLKNGVWSERKTGDGETRPTMLLEAIIAAVVKINGDEADTPEVREHYRELIKTKEGRESAMNTAEVKAEYTRLQAERAAERAAKASKAVEGQEASDFLKL